MKTTFQKKGFFFHFEQKEGMFCHVKRISLDNVQQVKQDYLKLFNFFCLNYLLVKPFHSTEKQLQGSSSHIQFEKTGMNCDCNLKHVFDLHSTYNLF